MPHVADGTFQPVAYRASYRPIVGNGNRGAACYNGDINNPKALYAVRTNEGPAVRGAATGPIKCYVTTDYAGRLAETDNSVEYLSTISDRWYSEPTCVGLSRINGLVYCTISGRDEGPDGQGGTLNILLRDDSPGADGSGPWTTVTLLPGSHGGGFGPYYGGNEPGHFDGVATAGEIVVLPSGRWMTNHTFWGRFGGESTSRYGVSTSDDQGASWTARLNVGWYMNGGIYSYNWSRGFGQLDGKWYVGGWGNVNGGKHYYSTDGAGWADIGTLGFGNSAGSSFPISTSSHLYRVPGGFGGNYPNGANGGWLERTGELPENMPSYTPAVYLAGYGLGDCPCFFNIGPEHSPIWVAVDYGRVLGFLRGGWKVGPATLGIG